MLLSSIFKFESTEWRDQKGRKKYSKDDMNWPNKT
jgi:hypothetical protein